MNESFLLSSGVTRGITVPMMPMKYVGGFEVGMHSTG